MRPGTQKRQPLSPWGGGAERLAVRGGRRAAAKIKISYQNRVAARASQSAARSPESLAQVQLHAAGRPLGDSRGTGGTLPAPQRGGAQSQSARCARCRLQSARCSTVSAKHPRETSLATPSLLAGRMEIIRRCLCGLSRLQMWFDPGPGPSRQPRPLLRSLSHQVLAGSMVQRAGYSRLNGPTCRPGQAQAGACGRRSRRCRKRQMTLNRYKSGICHGVRPASATRRKHRLFRSAHSVPRILPQVDPPGKSGARGSATRGLAPPKTDPAPERPITQSASRSAHGGEGAERLAVKGGEAPLRDVRIRCQNRAAA